MPILDVVSTPLLLSSLLAGAVLAGCTTDNTGAGLGGATTSAAGGSGGAMGGSGGATGGSGGAVGGDGASGGVGGMEGGSGGSTGGSDGQGGGSSGSGGGGGCDITGFTSAQGIAFEDVQGLVYQARDVVSEPFNVISVELYYELGASDQPHEVSAWENYETCHTCVLIFHDCSAYGCVKIFEANAGTLGVTVNDSGYSPGAFAGTLSNLEAVEVTIDPHTFKSTPVPNGQRWCVPSYSFDVTTIYPW